MTQMSTDVNSRKTILTIFSTINLTTLNNNQHLALLSCVYFCVKHLFGCYSIYTTSEHLIVIHCNSLDDFTIEPAKVAQVEVTNVDDTSARVEWDAVRLDQCCGFVLNYTVFYVAGQQPEFSKSDGRCFTHYSHSLYVKAIPNSVF